ncbi:hypothetical protein BH10PAT1_BH10PAT1_7460 [soil metagenome]
MLYKTLLLFLGLFFLISPSISYAQTNPSPVNVIGNWNLIFQDEFNDTYLDTNKWTTCYYYACTEFWEPVKQWYQSQNVVENNGTLKLILKKETVSPGDGNTYNYTSGMIQSGQVHNITDKPKFSFLYGYVEGRIKVPEGTSFWPAFWLTGTTQHPPEIDIFEYFSDSYQLSQGFWYKDSSGASKSTNIGGNLKGQYFANAWHTYGVDWDPTYIAFYFDGQLVKKYQGPIMSQPEVNKAQHILVNFAFSPPWLPAPDANTPTPSQMEVDYVRVWQRSGTTATNTPFPSSIPIPSPGPSDCSGNGVYLYSNNNYSGSCSKFTSDASSLSGYAVGNDSTSSLQIVGPYQATLFADGNYLGISTLVTSDIPNLSTTTVGGDSVSSLKVQLVSKQADANNDGVVNGIDYIIWLKNFNTNTTLGASHGDFNLDGIVNIADYILWLNNY